MPDVGNRINREGKSNCCGCRLCEEICPMNCITMQYDEEGFWYPHVDEENCVHCGLCNTLCPNVVERNSDFEPQIYAAYAKDEEICRTSSSGGIFQLLAREIIANGGVAYGAAYDKDLSVCHMRVETLEELPKLFGSKYVQSNMQGIYGLVKSDLIKGRKVLFSGTPCQIAAIKEYIGSAHENLLLVDLVCHGVPSPEVWREYLQSQRREKLAVTEFEFRSKEEIDDWENFKFKKMYDNGECKRDIWDGFLYGEAFLKNLSLRPSCYECQFLALSSGADITLGDCWRSRKTDLQLFNSWGMSVVSINSEKGYYAFESIKDKCNVESTGMFMLEQWNGAFQSEKESPFRNNYLEMIAGGMDRLSAMEKSLAGTISASPNIVLFGSYNARVVIRDVIDNLYEQYSYSSLRSLMSPIEKESFEHPEPIPEDFAGQMLYKDRKKLFVKDIETLSKEAYYIVIDLLEERFPVICENGKYVTQNVDFLAENCHRDYEKEFGEWKNACDKFIDIIGKHFNKEQVIFMESYLCTHWGMHGKYAKFDDFDRIEEMNQYLKKCNDYFIKKSGVEKILRVPDKLQYCQKYHRFGCKPYHLNYDAYQNLGRQLREFIR